jgi:hypothetical protein
MPITLTSTRIVATLVLVAGIAPNASAQMFISTGRDTLRGLPGVEVVVESLEQDLERDGLTRMAIQADVEGRLGAAGIAVYRSQKENPSAAKAYLYVQVDGVRLPTQDLHAIGVQVQLRQTLQSRITASNIVDAMTWDAHTVAVVRISEVVRARVTIQEYIETIGTINGTFRGLG